MSAERVAAGLSFLFAPGERPDAQALQAALGAGRIRAQIGWLHAQGHGAELLVDGLAFDCDGLAPGPAADRPRALAAPEWASRQDRGPDIDPSRYEAIRLYPGEHLSGGLGLLPVVRALLALSAQLATTLPTRAVYWAPSQTLIECAAFAGSTMAWLAGGAFPASGLVALMRAGDGSVSTRGLAHFIGQELTLRAPAGFDVERTGDLAARAVDWLVANGPLQGLTQIALPGMTLCAEPAQHARHILAWPMLEAQLR